MKVPVKPAALKFTAFILFGILFLVIFVWGISLQFISVHTGDWNYAYNLGYAALYLTGGLVGLFGARYVTTSISMGSALLYLGAAQISYAVGLIVWSYYNLIAHVSVPYPSVADIFFALFYILLAVGCWYFLQMVATHVQVQYAFEVLAIFFVSAIIIIGFLNTPDTSSGAGALARIFNIWYPLGDSLLISLSYIVFRAGRDKFRSGVFILILGLLVQVFADIIFSARSGAGTYWNGDISDILFAVSGSVLSLGIMTIFFDFIADPS
jgi:hypothetical protein